MSQAVTASDGGETSFAARTGSVHTEGHATAITETVCYIDYIIFMLIMCELIN